MDRQQQQRSIIPNPPRSTHSTPKQTRKSTQSPNTPTVTATVPNTSSRRTSAPSQQNPDKSRNSPSVEGKPASDEPAPKRPKRTLQLTASQRERKRAIDRDAQRSIRLKTKNYIAHLENLVTILENGGSSTHTSQVAQQPDGHLASKQDSERARELLSQLRRSEEEISRLKDMLSGVQRLIGTGVISAEDSEFKWLTQSNICNTDQTTGSVHTFQGGTQDYLESCASVYSRSPDSSSPMVELGYLPLNPQSSTETFALGYTSRSFGPQTSQQQDLYDSSRRLSAPSARPDPPTSGPVDALNSGDEGELFYISEREVNRALAGGHQSFTNQPLDEDIVVRAVLHGWRDVQEEYLLDKGWQALRCIDQVIFRECGIVDRMAILYMMRLKLLHQSNTNPQYLEPLPPFFQRGSDEDEDILKTTPVIEHFIWPGLRKCLCKDRKYINRKFSDAFKQSFKFLWPFDTSDAYFQDYSTQLYSITPRFKQRQWDLSSWTLRRDFFVHASELIGVIPIYDPPMDRVSVSTRSTAKQAAINAGHASQETYRQIPAKKKEERESEHSQTNLTHGNSHSPSQIPYSVPTSAPEISGMHAPYPAEVEAWLRDPELVPQYWNMGPGMNDRYEAAPQLWPNCHNGCGG